MQRSFATEDSPFRQQRSQRSMLFVKLSYLFKERSFADNIPTTALRIKKYFEFEQVV